jgi:hypothetical protein
MAKNGSSCANARQPSPTATAASASSSHRAGSVHGAFIARHGCAFVVLFDCRHLGWFYHVPSSQCFVPRTPSQPSCHAVTLCPVPSNWVMVVSCPNLPVTGKRGNLQSGSAGLDAIERQPAVRLPVGASPVQGCRPARILPPVPPGLFEY